MGLPAGHGDGVVVKDLVGDVHAGSDSRADGEDAGVEVGAVTEIRENVVGISEWRLTDPWCAFTTHLSEGGGVRLDPTGHVVAADARHGATAFRNLR